MTVWAGGESWFDFSYRVGTKEIISLISSCLEPHNGFVFSVVV